MDDEFVRGMRDVNGAGAEQQRLPPACQERDVGRVREHRRVEARHGRHPHRRHFEHVLDRHARLERRDRAANVRGIADRAEHHLGLGRRRDDVGRDAAGDQADRVVRPSEHRIVGQLDRAQRDQRVDQLVDRRLAELRETTSARRGPRARSLQPQDAARRERRAGCRSARR